MSFHIRRCWSDLNGKATKGFVIEVELLGVLIELCITR